MSLEKKCTQQCTCMIGAGFAASVWQTLLLRGLMMLGVERMFGRMLLYGIPNWTPNT